MFHKVPFFKYLPRIQYFVIDKEHKSAPHLFEQKRKCSCINVIITLSKTHNLRHNIPKFYHFMANTMVCLFSLLHSLLLLY
jgi:hypothetical protein